jgi:hypothetical protein
MMSVDYSGVGEALVKTRKSASRREREARCIAVFALVLMVRGEICDGYCSKEATLLSCCWSRLTFYTSSIFRQASLLCGVQIWP